MSLALGLDICAIIARIKKYKKVYKSIFKKKKKNHNEMEFLVKNNSYFVKPFISRSLTR